MDEESGAIKALEFFETGSEIPVDINSPDSINYTNSIETYTENKDVEEEISKTQWEIDLDNKIKNIVKTETDSSDLENKIKDIVADAIKGVEINIKKREEEKQKEWEKDFEENVRDIIEEEIKNELDYEALLKAVRLNPQCIDALKQKKPINEIAKDLQMILKKTDKYMLNDNDLSYSTKKLLNIVMAHIEETGDYKLAERFIEKLAKVKTAFHPATQKTMNVNIDLFDEQLRKWRLEREKLLIPSKEDESVIKLIDVSEDRMEEMIGKK